MKFTDRFVKVPIKVYDRAEMEMVGRASYEDSWLKINPFEISSYKPSHDKDNDDQVCTYVNMKDGNGFFVYLLPAEFEKLLNDSQK